MLVSGAVSFPKWIAGSVLLSGITLAALAIGFFTGRHFPALQGLKDRSSSRSSFSQNLTPKKKILGKNHSASPNETSSPEGTVQDKMAAIREVLAKPVSTKRSEAFSKLIDLANVQDLQKVMPLVEKLRNGEDR